MAIQTYESEVRYFLYLFLSGGYVSEDDRKKIYALKNYAFLLYVNYVSIF